jgi:phage shock protein PspC (stress-responsive transcriptional regulator)
MPPEPERLTRSRRDRVFAEVGGGLAVHLGWDVVLVRMAWVALTVLSVGAGVCNGTGVHFGVDSTAIRLICIAPALVFGAGILIYLLLWIAMPLIEKQPHELIS